MDDVQRLKQWMEEHDMTTKELAHRMGLTYVNVYHTLVARPKINQKGNKINGNFIICFMKAFGLAEAQKVFEELNEVEVA